LVSCLAKDPDDRWQSGRDLLREMKWVTSGGQPASAAAPAIAVRRVAAKTWVTLAMAFATTTVLAAAAAAYLYLSRPSPSVVRSHTVSDPKTGSEVLFLPLSGDRKPIPFAQTSFSETHGQISPDVNLHHVGGGGYHTFSVAPDGQRFLIPVFSSSSTETVVSPITVVLNWTAGIGR
jgi:hypothetical protein